MVRSITEGYGRGLDSGRDEMRGMRCGRMGQRATGRGRGCDCNMGGPLVGVAGRIALDGQFRGCKSVWSRPPPPHAFFFSAEKGFG
jgi:hypothetical protein